MPAQIPILEALETLKLTVAAMGRADGYWFDYGKVVEGFYDWDAERNFENPTVQIALQVPDSGDVAGRERSGLSHRQMDELHFIVHLKASADVGVVTQALRCRQDLHKALMADRQIGDLSGRRNIFSTRCEVTYPVPDGATVDYIVTIRWDHVTGDMTDDGS